MSDLLIIPLQCFLSEYGFPVLWVIYSHILCVYINNIDMYNLFNKLEKNLDAQGSRCQSVCSGIFTSTIAMFCLFLCLLYNSIFTLS